MMECDSMHSAIEYAQKNLSIFSLHEWINVLKTARRHNPYKVELPDHTEFFDLKALAKQLVTYRNKSGHGSVKWPAIRCYGCIYYILPLHILSISTAYLHSVYRIV